MFRLRAGNGGKEFPTGFNGTDSDVAVLDIPLSKLNLFDNQPHNVSWHIAIAEPHSQEIARVDDAVGVLLEPKAA